MAKKAKDTNQDKRGHSIWNDLQLIYRLCHHFLLQFCVCWLFMFLSWETISQPKGTLCSTMKIFLCRYYTFAIFHSKNLKFPIPMRNTRKLIKYFFASVIFPCSLLIGILLRCLSKAFSLPHLYPESWLILPQLPPMRTWRPFCI